MSHILRLEHPSEIEAILAVHDAAFEAPGEAQ